MATAVNVSGAAPAVQSPIATFFPGYFALVMATGIVSLAGHFLGHEYLAQALLWLNVFAYVVLWTITAIRFVRYRPQLIYDLTHHARGVTFLTKVAATCVLGTQFAVLTPFMRVAIELWLIGLGLWAVLLYAFFTAVTFREPKPSLEAGINGAWLLVVVSTESICVLGAIIAPAFAVAEPVLFVSLSMYLIGTMLYIVFISLILYRWMFLRITAETLTPSYWINMGALAITTLAGSRLLLVAPVELSPGAFDVSKRFYLPFLGSRDMVDSIASDRRCLATRGAASAADLRSAILEPGVPPGNVYRRDLYLCQGHGSRGKGRDQPDQFFLGDEACDLSRSVWPSLDLERPADLKLPGRAFANPSRELRLLGKQTF